MEVAGLEQARVGGHEVAGRQPDDVAGDEVAPANLAPGSSAEGGRRRRHGVAQSLGDAMGAVGLHEVEHDAQNHHEHDDGGVDPFAEQRGGDAGDQQNDDQRIRQEQEDLNEAGRARRPRGLVRADLAEPAARFVGGQASPRGMKLREERVDWAVWRRHGERRPGGVITGMSSRAPPTSRRSLWCSVLDSQLDRPGCGRA